MYVAQKVALAIKQEDSFLAQGKILHDCLREALRIAKDHN
jgi:hypothetical protein